MDESRIIIEFDYRPQRVKLVAVTLLATAGVALMTYVALTLGGPIDVKEFRLSRRQGRVFFGVNLQCANMQFYRRLQAPQDGSPRWRYLHSE